MNVFICTKSVHAVTARIYSFVTAIKYFQESSISWW